jgi:hypothetical protein
MLIVVKLWEKGGPTRLHRRHSGRTLSTTVIVGYLTGIGWEPPS